MGRNPRGESANDAISLRRATYREGRGEQGKRNTSNYEVVTGVGCFGFSPQPRKEMHSYGSLFCEGNKTVPVSSLFARKHNSKCTLVHNGAQCMWVLMWVVVRDG